MFALIFVAVLFIGFQYRMYRVHSMQLRWLESIAVWIEDKDLVKANQGLKFMRAFEQYSLVFMLRVWASTDVIDQEFHAKAARAKLAASKK